MLWECVIVFIVGMLAAVIDIDSSFRARRISYVIERNVHFWGFILLNGTLSSVMLFWSLSSDKDSLINKTLPATSPWGKTFIIAFAVPLLLRSKLFSVGEAQTSAGPAIAYDWLRIRTMTSVNVTSAQRKGEIATQYSARFVGRAGLDTEIKDWVDDYVKPFATPAEQAQLEQEFKGIQAAYTSSALSQDHLRALIRWAMDNAAIRYIEEKLKSLR